MFCLFEVDGADDRERRQVLVHAPSKRAALNELVGRGEGNPRLLRTFGEREEAPAGLPLIEGRMVSSEASPWRREPRDWASSPLVQRPVLTIAAGVFLGLLGFAALVVTIEVVFGVR